jgi:hypothetical protein
VKIGALDDYELDPVQTENSQWMSLIDNLTVKALAKHLCNSHSLISKSLTYPAG